MLENVIKNILNFWFLSSGTDIRCLISKVKQSIIKPRTK